MPNRDPIYVIEASVPTIIIFCVIHKDVDDLYKWHAKSGADEDYWAETSAININHGNARLDHINSY